MEAGHTSRAADEWACEHIPSWAVAPRISVASFSVANARTWDEIARNSPQPWKKNMARCANDWVTYWRV